MTSTGADSPFNDAYAEVHLTNAPLVRVLSQVKWDDLTTFRSDFEAKAGALGEALSDDYPIATKDVGMQFSVGPMGVTPQQADAVHKFLSSDETWRVYLGPNFMTFETTKYTSKDDFCDRFEKVLNALNDIATIPRAVRVGFRYVNRVDQDSGFDEIHRLVRPEVLGGFNIPTSPNVIVRHSLTETLYGTAKGTLLAKWAVLPSRGAMDPTIEGVDGPSWVLDLDAFEESKPDFVPSDLVRRIKVLSELGYGFFRWAVTPEFLDRFSGDTNASD